MEKISILGGKRLVGSVEISGAKNAAVAVLPATLLVSGTARIENLPDIADVANCIDILRVFGAKVNRISPTCIEVDCSNVHYDVPPQNKACKMRATYYLIGSLLARFGKASVPMPGGCNFGARPIDQHLKGFRMLGAHVAVRHGMVEATAEKGKLVGDSVYLDIVSVGATINIMLAAVLAEGTTHIENAAKEPHIVNLANFLNAMGANVKGAGTDVIRITGVEKLTGGTHTIIPDQIEAGTFMIAAAATGGDVRIKNIIPKHLEPITAKLEEIGVKVTEFDDEIRVVGSKNLIGTNIKTLPYPGFPTDLQPQIVALLSISRGVSMVTESVWDNRFQYVGEIKKMGADIKTDGHSAVIQGVDKLTGAEVIATDLRGGASLVIAGLVAKGVTNISEIKHIDRGYTNLVEKLRSLGAQVTRKSEKEEFNKVVNN